MTSNPSLIEVINDVDSKVVQSFCRSSSPMQFVSSFCHLNYGTDNQNLKHTVFAVIKDTAKNYALPVVIEENVRKIPGYFYRDLPPLAARRVAKTTNFSTSEQTL